MYGLVESIDVIVDFRSVLDMKRLQNFQRQAKLLALLEFLFKFQSLNHRLALNKSVLKDW